MSDFICGDCGAVDKVTQTHTKSNKYKNGEFHMICTNCRNNHWEKWPKYFD